VQVTYQGPNVANAVVSDIITLDPVAPTVPESLVVATDDGWYVGLRMKDAGTGVSRVSVLDTDRRTIRDKVLCKAGQCDRKVDGSFTSGRKKPRYARVADAAGNVRTVRLRVSAAATSCKSAEYVVPYKLPPYDYRCVRLNQSCGAFKQDLAWKQSLVRCRRPAGDYIVVKAG
jgi:hypothetical protein